MPSPFPGMDPYLEGPLWTTFHVSFAVEVVRQLAPQLRPRYLALPVERFVLEIADAVSVLTADVYPDVGVTSAENDPEDAAVATSALVAPIRMATVLPQPVPQVTIEIRDVSERRLVTAIEILSPTNKRGRGRDEYLAKRQRLLLSTAHLLEIDLLRSGERLPMREPLPEAAYFVFLSRAEKRPLTEVWPIHLASSLPTVPVPLLAQDADVGLDLQAAFVPPYDLVGYDLVVDYTTQPEPPLAGESQAWAEDLFRPPKT